MLQSIRRAYKTQPDHPLLHTCVIRYRLYLDHHAASIEEPVRTVIDQVGFRIFFAPNSLFLFCRLK